MSSDPDREGDDADATQAPAEDAAASDEAATEEAAAPSDAPKEPSAAVRASMIHPIAKPDPSVKKDEPGAAEPPTAAAPPPAIDAVPQPPTDAAPQPPTNVPPMDAGPQPPTAAASPPPTDAAPTDAAPPPPTDAAPPDAPPPPPTDAAPPDAAPEQIEDPVAFTIQKPADRWTPDPLAGMKLSSPDLGIEAADESSSSSGSVDVSVSSPALPAASASGSMDVSVSSPAIPEAVPAVDSEPVRSEPISTAHIASAVAREGSEPVRRRDRLKKVVEHGVSEGVETLGTGITTLGEGVSKIGDVTKKVPLVGANIGKLGEGLTKAGESIHALPRVAQTRRGRLLVRSVIVGFLLVFAWIAVIVSLQLRSHDTPDFRPIAEKILVEISKGPTAIGEVYEKSSPRFQEVVSKERFIDELTDLNATNGKFKEITAINETLVTKGPTGRIGRVSLTASYEHGITRGSISFHWHHGEWKLLGIGIEVPPAVKITQAEREKRVAACLDDKGRDVSDQRAKCDVRDAAETILEMIRDGKTGEVWDAANDIFKQQETRANFIRIQEDQRMALGNYKRLLTVTEARALRGITATFDAVAEFDKSSGVRVVFGFTRPSKTARWQLRSYKVVVPMPRPDEEHPPLVPPSPDVNPNDPPLLREAAPELEQKVMPPPAKGSGGH